MMERQFHEELRELNQKIGAMGELVGSRTREAMRALVERREELAEAVATGDQEVNDLESEIDDLTLRLLALQNPVASDLRHVRSAIKVNTDLERIGDQAVNIAEAALRLISLPPLRPLIDVSRLSEMVLTMLDDAIKAFIEQDVPRARAVLACDDDADATRDTIFRVLLTHMMADPGTVERALGLILVSRALERIGDHATNIAEDLIFLVEGRVVRRAEERDA
jgi:phosphate transport system protein